ncbi:exosome complex component CSL4-like [Sarcoptes scabiei]|nr:exosome complex component CSL4-like [Sarcoptes scabiei]
MWSNLNESFSAITDHFSSLRNSLIDQQQEQSSDSNSNHRELELKISLLKNEIIRHREIAKTYKDRWLEAEKCCQKVFGHFSQTYNDDIDFREDANDETEDRCELEERDSLQTSPSNERLLKNFEQTECGNEIKQSIDLHARVEHKHFANLSIDSASKLILSLQDEIVRLRTDGEHWRKLAKERRLNLIDQLIEINDEPKSLEPNSSIDTHLETAEFDLFDAGIEYKTFYR